MSKPILCVDFDGVIHSYTSGWKGPTIVTDPPTQGALKWLWKATEWFDVQVYSSRSKEPGGCEAMLDWMTNYAIVEFGVGHPMTGSEPGEYPITFAHQKPAAFLTIDDRAICFEGDWNNLDAADLLQFKPWNKRPPSAPLPPVEDGWQPIESAPKDGTIIMAWPCELEGGHLIAVPAWWYVHPNVQGWVTDVIDCADCEFEPTYWLPPPPSRTGQ